MHIINLLEKDIKSNLKIVVELATNNSVDLLRYTRKENACSRQIEYM